MGHLGRALGNERAGEEALPITPTLRVLSRIVLVSDRRFILVSTNL